MSQEVGKVSVRVVPDTSTFRRELEAQLKSLNDKMDITFGADTSRIRKEVEAATKGLPDGKVKVTADTSAIQSDVKKATKGLAGGRSLDSYLIKMKVDRDNAIRDVEVAIAEMDSYAKANPVETKISLQNKQIRAGLATTLAELQAVAVLNPIDIPVKLDNNIFRNAATLTGMSAAKGMAGLGNTVSGAMQGLAGLGASAMSSLAGMAPMLMLIAAAATLVAPALALVSGALTLIPAAVAGVAAPIGAVILGLDGIKKAAENAGLTASSTGKRGKVTTTVGEQLAELKKAVSGTFEKDLTAPFEKLTNIVPKLTQPMQAVASGISSLASGFIDSISSVDGMRRIQDSITNIGKGLQNAGPGVKSFTDGLLTMVDKVATRFPGLGEGFSKLGDQFSNWVTKFTTPDATGVSKLDETLKSLKSTWDQISGMGGDLLSKGFEWMSDPSFGQDISTFFGNIRSFVNETLPSLKNGFSDFAGMLDGIAPTFKAIGATVETMGNLTKIFQGNKEGLTGLWDQITRDPKAQEAGTELGTQLAADLTAATKMGIDANGGVVGPTADLVPKDVGSVVQQQIAGQIEAASAPTKEALQNSITANGIDENVAKQLTQQVEAAITGAQHKMGELGPALQTKINEALLPLGTIAEKVGAAFSVIGPAFSAAFGNLVLAATTGCQQITVAVSSALVNLPQVVQGAFSGLASAAAGAFSPVVAMVVQGSNQILTAVSSTLTQLPSIVAGSFGAMTQAISGQMALAVQTVAGACGQMVSAAMSTAGSMFAAGASIGSSFASGIRSMSGLVAAAANDLMAAAHKPIPNSPADEGPFSGKGWVLYSGQSVGDAFAQGITNTTGKVGDAATQMAQTASDAIAKQAQDVKDQSAKLAEAMQVADQGSIKIGSISTGIKTGGMTDQKNALKVQQEQVDLQIQQMQLDKAMAGDKGQKAALQAELDKLKAQKDGLAVQQKQLDVAGKQGGESSKMAGSIDQAFNTMTKMPADFALANANQFMSDLGMSGEGLLPTLMQEGMGMVQNTIFNVSGISDALSMDKRRQATQALSFA